MHGVPIMIRDLRDVKEESQKIEDHLDLLSTSQEWLGHSTIKGK